MELIYVIFTSIASLIVLFLLTKVIGNKQMSELNMFDYINGITIGSIAAEMATSLEKDFFKPLIAMIVYGGATFLISFIANKSIKVRRFINGRAMILLENGRLYKKNLAKARIDLNEFLAQCRINGFFNIADIETAILEPNGRISILPKVSARPVNVNDMNLTPEEERPVVNVILDGSILDGNLAFTGNNRNWLESELRAQKVSSLQNVFLATCDKNNNLSVYLKTDEKPDKDIFQ